MNIVIEKRINFKSLFNIDWGQVSNIETRRIILWAPFIYGAGAALCLGPFCDFNQANLILILVMSLIIIFIGIFINNIRFYKSFLAIRVFFLIAFVLVGGILSAQYRSQYVAAPIIKNAKIYDKVEGEIISINRAYSGAWRAKIRVISISNIEKTQTPYYLRLNLNDISYDKIGDIINCKAFIAPPPLNIHPNAFDFARFAWFAKIGGVGRCNGEIEYKKSNASNGFKKYLEISRSKLSKEISKGEIGGGRGFLAAVATGDRSYISSQDMNALQISGLGHIVSVSGLHIGLVAGLVFIVLKKIFSFFPIIALRYDVRKIAASFAFIIVFFYTFFSGAEAPALRALIMTGVMTIGVLINRKAISMRGLVVAAMLLLVIRPENALDAGFLMSFLATMALVALWEYWELKQFLKPKNFVENITFWIYGAALTSFVAGLATIPISLVNFQTVNTYGLLANLLSAPISDFIVAPSAIIGFLFKSTIIGDWSFSISSWGLGLILKIAYYFSGLQGANASFDGFSVISSSLMVFAIVWFCLFLSKIRFFAIFPLIISLIIWFNAPQNLANISTNAMAILKMPLNKNMDAKLCFAKGGKFYSNRLISASALQKNIKDELLAQIEGRYQNSCSINGGNWEAHFINELNKGRKPIISLTIEGKTYMFDGENLPMGAQLVKQNGKIKIIAPKARTIWARAQSKSLNFNNDDIMKPIHLEP